MSLLPDPAALTALADRISGHATATRSRAAQLGAALAATQWHGIAATAFDGQAALALSALRGAAGRLDTAADALRRHAGRLSTLYADLEHAGLDTVRTLEDVAMHPGRLLADGANLVGDGAHLAGDALHLVGIG